LFPLGQEKFLGLKLELKICPIANTLQKEAKTHARGPGQKQSGERLVFEECRERMCERVGRMWQADELAQMCG
jgi:hypothetical protein